MIFCVLGMQKMQFILVTVTIMMATSFELNFLVVVNEAVMEVEGVVDTKVVNAKVVEAHPLDALIIELKWPVSTCKNSIVDNIVLNFSLFFRTSCYWILARS